MRILLRCVLVLLLILSIGGAFPNSATALLRQHHDAPGVLRYHSQVSIKDNLGYSWQVVLYKVFNPGQSEDIHLRLVGFPGVFEFHHPSTLEIVTRKGKLFAASDVYQETSPVPYVGEYKFKDVLSKLATADSLKLNLPVDGKSHLQLKIPKAVVSEWQMLITEVNT